MITSHLGVVFSLLVYPCKTDVRTRSILKFSRFFIMADEKPIFEYHEESQSEKLARKSKESPFMIVGIAGLLSAVGYGAYKFKNRGSMSTSVFLMQFRVISQGIAVGTLTAGMAYTLFNTHFNKPHKELKPN